MSAETVKVSTTMRPGDEIEVGEAEFTDLARSGILATVNGKPVTAKKKESE